MTETGPIILASTSAARQAMLRDAGVPFVAEAPRVDEKSLRASLLAEGHGPRGLADALAEAKAVKVSARHPGRLVLGADQVLALGEHPFAKPASVAEARAQLLSLRGARHMLLSAAVVAVDGGPVWRHVGVARMDVRAFSEAFLDRYLAAEGEAALQSVGAYRIEAAGVQLFDRIEGDHFTILGLPLLELLRYLRVRGVCPE